MKYKVLVVDDKPLIRQALACSIDWVHLGCEVIGQAEDGMKALEIANTCKPELVISDIKMPGMDGLELTERIKEKSPHTQIIIITGYQEFEYARRALSLGVSDLVLKPIQNDVMEQKVKKALETLERQRKMDYQVRTSIRARQIQFLQERVQERDGYEGEEKLKELCFFGKEYYLLAARPRSGDAQMRKEIWKQTARWMEQRQKQMSWMVFEWISGKNQLIVVFEQEKRSARERKVYLKQALHLLNQELKEQYQTACCFAVSRTSNDVNKLPELYRDTLELMEKGFFVEEENLLFVQENPLTAAEDGKNILGELEGFCRGLKEMDGAELEWQSSQIIERVIQAAKGDEFRIKCLVTEICITLLKQWAREVRREDLNNASEDLLSQINTLTGKKDSKAFLLQFASDIRQKLLEDQGGENPIIRDAVSYLSVHYRENISLTDLAEKLSVNPSYLSRLFKKETGKNFGEILTEYRIQKAKELLRQPGSRVVEVCEQVGYSDYTYFYQVFKKVENLSPSEYKKRCKNI